MEDNKELFTIEGFKKTDLEHHGIKGQKWGERRYQNKDGSLTPLGKQHYHISSGSSKSNSKGTSSEVTGGGAVVDDEEEKIDKDLAIDSLEQALKQYGENKNMSAETILKQIRRYKEKGIITNQQYTSYMKRFSNIKPKPYGPQERISGPAPLRETELTTKQKITKTKKLLGDKVKKVVDDVLQEADDLRWNVEEKILPVLAKPFVTIAEEAGDLVSQIDDFFYNLTKK